MLLEVDDDFSDDIVIRSLANSYISVAANLKDPEMCWHEDDKASWEELLPALKIVLNWYSMDADAEIKRAKKRK